MARYILHSPGLAPSRRSRLTSNVRRHTPLPMDSIALTVSYGLREYLSIVRDYGVWHQATEGGKTEATPNSRGPLKRIYHKATIYLLAPPIFFLKKRAVGECRFTVDHEGITRRSKSGDVAFPWKEVLRVHRLSEAYLVEKSEGAVPLPYRVFTQVQRAKFESIITARNVATVDTR